MIRKAIEGETTWFNELTPSAIPRPLPSGITVQLAGNLIGLDIRGVVGALPLTNGDTLQITPKIGQVNFLRLLFKAEGSQQDLSSAYEEFVQYSETEHSNIEQIVARQLLFCAEEILRRSPQRGRIRRRHVGVFAGGQIDPVATALNIARRREAPVVYTTKDRTEDIAENRVITEAMFRAWPMLNKPTRTKLSDVYDKWIGRFPRSRNLSADLESIERGFADCAYGGSRGYYRKTLMLAQIILGSSGLGFADAALIQGDAVLLNTADVFEKYLRTIVAEAYSKKGFVVSKGGVGTISLYTDGTYELVPDIIITKDQKTLLVADAKYKVPDASDHYQMAAYLNCCGVQRGLLLAPLFEGDAVVVREYATSDRVLVREAYLPMSNLATTEEFLGTVVERFAF